MIDILLLSLVALSLSLGQLARISLGGGIYFSALELVVLLHGALLLLRMRGKLPLQHTTLLRISVAWFAYVTLLLVATSFGKGMTDNVRAGMYIFRLSIYASYVLLLTHAHIRQFVFAKIFTIVSHVVPAICLLQYVLIPDLRFLAQFGWDPHMYRAVGVIFDPPIAGAVLGSILFASVIRADHVRSAMQSQPGGHDGGEGRSVSGLIPIWLPILLNFFAIIFLYSRSTYIAVGLVLCLYYLVHRRISSAVLWIALFSLFIYFAPRTIPAYLTLESAKIERTSTVMSRRVEIEQGLRAWMSHPLLGIGFNRVAEYKRHNPLAYSKSASLNHSSSAFHSFWLTQLATTGIVGFALLVWAYGLAMRRSVQWALVLTIPALIGVLDNVVFHPFVLTLYVLIYFSTILDSRIITPTT